MMEVSMRRAHELRTACVEVQTVREEDFPLSKRERPRCSILGGYKLKVKRMRKEYAYLSAGARYTLCAVHAGLPTHPL
jgi:hypothetical protein